MQLLARRPPQPDVPLEDKMAAKAFLTEGGAFGAMHFQLTQTRHDIQSCSTRPHNPIYNCFSLRCWPCTCATERRQSGPASQHVVLRFAQSRIRRSSLSRYLMFQSGRGIAGDEMRSGNMFCHASLVTVELSRRRGSKRQGGTFIATISRCIHLT